MLQLDAQTTAAALPFPALIEALRQLFISGCDVPSRQVLALPAVGDAPAVTSLIMPAWHSAGTAHGRYGVKIVNIAPGNAALGLPGLHASYLLFDAATGKPLALIDGNQITSRRTAAASALAASFLARPDARHLLVVGAGRVAALLPQAYQAVRPISHVTVWARHADAAMRLATEFSEQGFEAQASTDLAQAVSRADVVSCATLATEPVIQGGWLRAGCHLDLIGSFTPAMREADDACFAGASLFVDSEEALVKSGDLLGPMQRGVFAASDVLATLQSLCRGRHVGRRSDAERTVFKSVGNALEDLAAAVLACPAH